MQIACVMGASAAGVGTRRLMLALAALLFAAAPAGARDSGIQFSPDGKRVFVNKDVDGVRFAITLNTDDGTVTGNAFDPTGGDPQFIVCQPEPPVANRFTCAVADPCTAAPCDGQYIDVGERTVPPDFFTAIGTASVETASVASGDAGDVAARVAAIATGRASGIQISPDQKRIFVSKDVDDTRFAITRNGDDSPVTVTGNVFSFSGGPPTFIICRQTTPTDDLTFDCAAAPPCTTSPCQPFVDVGTRTVPTTFFDLPDPVVGVVVLSDEFTQTMRAGVGTIPTPGAVSLAMPASCPGGGTVQAGEGAVAFDQCRVGKLVCSGTASAAGTTLDLSGLQCHDGARVKDLSLSGTMSFGSSGLSGTLSATSGAKAAFDLAYDGVALTESTFGTPTSGVLAAQNQAFFFGGSFTHIEQAFDGSQFIRIVRFSAIPGGPTDFLRLDVTTGQLSLVASCAPVACGSDADCSENGCGHCTRRGICGP